MTKKDLREWRELTTKAYERGVSTFWAELAILTLVTSGLATIVYLFNN